MSTHKLDKKADKLNKEKEYDFIVVGSGAGGGPVAVRLAEAGYSVLVLEVGGPDDPDDYKVPAWHARSLENEKLSWEFYVHHYPDPKQEERGYKKLPAGQGNLLSAGGHFGWLHRASRTDLHRAPQQRLERHRAKIRR
jgi:choline dehydrogenase